MRDSSALRRLLTGLGIVAALVFAVFAMLFLRGRMQQQAGLDQGDVLATMEASPTPSVSAATDEASASPTPTPLPTPFVDPGSVQGKDRGLLVAAVQARLHALGYFSYKPTGYFAVMTQYSVRAFQQANGLLVDGVVSDETLSALFSLDAPYAAATPVPLPNATPPAVRPRNYGEPLPFAQVDALLADGSRFLVVDLTSQLYFNAVRVGGVNHMEITPASDEDYARYLAIFSGRSTFEKRPCVVEFEDEIIAASLCGWLHADNNTPVLCLYFFNSTANDSAMQDAEHNANLIVSSGGAVPE